MLHRWQVRSPEFARQLLLLLVLSLATMQPAIDLLGFSSVPTDLIFVACALAWIWSLCTGESRFTWHNAFWLLALYFAALVASAIAAESPFTSVPKLLTQVYLLSLPVLVYNLVRTQEDLRAVFRWWLAGTAVVALVGFASLLAFIAEPSSRLLEHTTNPFGTLPPGNYPRLRLTFLNANMACNYLTVSLMFLLIARKLDWLGKGPFGLLLGGIAVSALLTISPGLGGLVLAACLWIWLLERDHSRLRADAALVIGLLVALLFVGAMAITLIIHPTAPFLINVPVLDVKLAPAVRLMTWIDAARNFFADPILGRGIGADSVHVFYQNPSGDLLTLTDAHNTFLNISVQSGIVGLAALTLIVGYVFGRLRVLHLPLEEPQIGIAGLVIAFLSAFAFEGLGGSFEDTRHLWVLFGLILAADSNPLARVAPGLVRRPNATLNKRV